MVLYVNGCLTEDWPSPAVTKINHGSNIAIDEEVVFMMHFPNTDK